MAPDTVTLDTSISQSYPYAVVRVGGRSVLVEPGKVVTVDARFDTESVVLDQVQLVKNTDGIIKIGTPTVSGATVSAKPLAEVKGDKIMIYKKRRRKGYTKKQGHRQVLTRLQIEAINS